MANGIFVLKLKNIKQELITKRSSSGTLNQQTKQDNYLLFKQFKGATTNHINYNQHFDPY